MARLAWALLGPQSYRRMAEMKQENALGNMLLCRRCIRAR